MFAFLNCSIPCINSRDRRRLWPCVLLEIICTCCATALTGLLYMEITKTYLIIWTCNYLISLLDNTIFNKQPSVYIEQSSLRCNYVVFVKKKIEAAMLGRNPTPDRFTTHSVSNSIAKVRGVAVSSAISYWHLLYSCSSGSEGLIDCDFLSFTHNNPSRTAE